MGEPFIGSEAVARGDVTKSQLCTRYIRLLRDVYIDSGVEVTAALRAKAGWLWARRRGVVAGFSAAALHGSKWVDDEKTGGVNPRQSTPFTGRSRHVVTASRTTRSRSLQAFQSPRRPGQLLDLGCWYPTMTAVAAIDALARATDIKAADVELLAQRYAGRRGIARARQAVGLFDAGAQSPKESWLRVVLIQAGLPRPQTQIPVCDEFGS